MLRAKQRATLTYRVLPRLSLGVEYNPRADSASPLANWVALTETSRRPAVVFGSSSDRIGTPSGQAYYVTVSKDIEERTDLPLAPYVGVAYGTFEDTLRAIGGLRIRFGRGWASTLIYDGRNLHPTLERRFRQRHVLTLLWVATEHVGASYSIAF